jgi:hypothetical protein
VGSGGPLFFALLVGISRLLEAAEVGKPMA